MDEGILAPYPASNNPAQPNTTYSVDGIRVSLDDFIQNLQIFFKGNLGLNEALARRSADARNFQSRLVRTVFTIENSGSRESEDGDLIIFDKGEGQIISEQWETTALSRGGNLGSLIGLVGQDKLSTTIKSETWNAPPDVQGIRSNLAVMLATGGCGAFIEDLLNQLATSSKNPRVPGSVLDLFDMVKAQSGFVRGGSATKNKVSATVKGQFRSKDASIHLGSGFSFMVTTQQEKANTVAKLDAFNVLHEIVHLAGKNTYYDDVQVARLLFSSLGLPGLPNRRDYKSKRDFIGANSTYFSNALATKCPPL
jgi:hypothetical protein